MCVILDISCKVLCNLKKKKLKFRKNRKFKKKIRVVVDFIK